MWKNIALFIAALLLMGGISAVSWWQGSKDQTQTLIAAVEQARRQEMVTGVLGCIYGADSDLLRFLQAPDTTSLGEVAWRLERCEEILDIIGTVTENDDLGEIFGEANLFLDGYTQSSWELITKRLEVQDGQLSEEEFQVVQEELLQETRQFIDRLEYLLYLGVQHVP